MGLKTTVKRKKTNKPNKTKKGGFTRTLCEQGIKDVMDVNKLACFLRSNRTLQNYIVEVGWSLLYKINYITIQNPQEGDFTTVVKGNITETKDATNTITNIGFTEEETTQIIECIVQNNRFRFFRLAFLYTKIHCTTALFARLNNPVFESLYIRTDPILCNEFLIKFKQIFSLPNDFNNDNFKYMYEQTRNDRVAQRAFDTLVVKILHTTDNKMGVVQLNYNRESFSRVDFSGTKVAEPIQECFNDISDSDNIYGVKNIYNFDKTVTKSIFEMYHRQLIGGISGSVYFLHFLFTRVLQIPNGASLLSKILCIAVLDYVPLWHSLEEILLTITIEYQQYGIPKYTLDQEPLVYFKNIVCGQLSLP